MISTALLTLLALMALAIPVAASMGVLGLMLGQLTGAFGQHATRDARGHPTQPDES